ncbi:MAG: isoaspartyl peptidase/L-asparaginase [Bacteroides sp.]|jgi:beta-aspartyl-peptidase (threonine type)|nr:isoaspartyl peptidase/L-asparaginase [Bacteroides sp.]
MRKLVSVVVFTILVIFSFHVEGQGRYTLVIHGGSGNISRERMSVVQEEAYLAKLNEALEAGEAILKEGGGSLDAVVAAIMVLEDSPLFNAGKGAVFNFEGRNELDASIMDGRTLQAGAVAGITNVKNPITAARKVMEHSPHVMLTGRGAEQFAFEQGLEIVDPSYFFDQRRWDQYREYLRNNTQFRGAVETDYKMGTVGAVALDVEGNLSAATSTGGMTGKRFGRIGDSPIIGAGTYANNQSCAISATGHGEYFIRNVVAYDVSAQMLYLGKSLEEAANYIILDKLKEQGGDGGIIAVDHEGNVAMPFNTTGMFRGFVKSTGETEVKIFQ